MLDFDLGDVLERRLADPAGLPRRMIAPTLAYGRHRGPAMRASRIAAVALAFYRDERGGWTIPLTLRPRSLQHHGGQICLPGGRIEAGEDVATAALREFREELGVRPDVRRMCGQLSTQYVYASDNIVHPVVFLIDPPGGPWHPDPAEVEQVIPLPLAVLLDPISRAEMIKTRIVRRRDQAVGSLDFRATVIRHARHDIWGATALILDQLAQLLLPTDDGSDGLPRCREIDSNALRPTIP